MVKFLFSVHTITEAKQSNRQGGARAVDLPGMSFDLARPGVAPPLITCKGQMQTATESRAIFSRPRGSRGTFVSIPREPRNIDFHPAVFPLDSRNARDSASASAASLFDGFMNMHSKGYANVCGCTESVQSSETSKSRTIRAELRITLSTMSSAAQF